MEKSCQLPYGTAPNVHVTATCANRVAQEKMRASFRDRESHAEACTPAFVAEHSLPLAMVPHIIKYVQEMSRDQKVLENLSMERQTAAYKLKEGLALSVRKRLVLEMRKSKFSLNLDEATSNNTKVLTVIVGFFSESLGETVIDYYDPVSLTAAIARTLYEAVHNLLERDEIPAANLVLVLTDSVNYMLLDNFGCGG